MRHLVGCVLVVAIGCGDNLGGNHAPSVNGAVRMTAEDTPLMHTIAATDPEDDPIAFRIATNPEHGEVALGGNRIVYTPSPNYHGRDALTFAVSDGDAESSATLDITVTPVNDAPVGGADSFASAEDTTLTVSTVTLLANDEDVDDDPLTVVSVGNAAHGAVTMSGTDVRFVPELDFSGEASFEYQVRDGAVSAIVRVTVSIAMANDPPTAVDDTGNTPEDTPFVVSGTTLAENDSDPEIQNLMVTDVGNATNGTVALSGTDITFTPTANFAGQATFEYTVSDGNATDVGLVTVTVAPVNDPPVAGPDTAATDEDNAVTIAQATLLVNDSDVENASLSITGVGNATNGTAALSGTDVTFTPNANFAGTATFEYTVTDGTAPVTGVVTVTVNGIADPPIANDDLRSTVEDASLALTAASLLANDVDPDSTPVVTGVGNATHGTVALDGTTATFVPEANFAGDASFEYTISDGATSDTAVVTIAVTAVNDPPVALDDTEITAEDTPVSIAAATLTANDTDVDNPSLDVTSVTAGTGGTVSLSSGTITFTPAANFNGPATFSYTVSDGTLSDTGLVAVAVSAVNDAPVAGNDTGGVQTNNSLVLQIAQLLANDSDVDGPATVITAVQNAINGTAALNLTTITFTPDTDFVGTATFEYVVSDGTATAVGLVTITVVAGVACGDGVITAPETCDDANTNPNDGCSATCQVEPGYQCTGEPSVCAPVCGDGIPIPPEQCDDQNMVNEDGCTNLCRTGVICTAAEYPGGDRFAVHPQTGTCYVSFDDDQQTFAQAEAACVGAGGYLATITSASEDAVVRSVQNTSQNPWIGAGEDAIDDDAIFDWVTDDTFGFTNFAPGQPDNDATTGGEGDCLHLFDPQGRWNDTNCNFASFVTGRICEIELVPCGDSILQPSEGEECDDSNTTSGDDCSATCQLEVGCGDGNLDPGEECDDDNTQNGDACSSTCQVLQGCGDGDLDPGEECDDDNTQNGDACSSTCQLLVGCGDGEVDPGEECDDDNTQNGDACSSTCQVLEGCGDGNPDPGEECDDDNVGGGDGCSATCQLEDGCGDGNLDAGEECDDDNTSSNDGCSATCTREIPVRFSFTGAAGNEASFPADTLAPGLESIPRMSRGSGLDEAQATGEFSSELWTELPVLDPNDYYTFTLTPVSGATMHLAMLELDERRSPSGPLRFSVRSSLDGFTTDIVVIVLPDDTNTRRDRQIPLPAAFRNVATPLEFRIYGYASENPLGTWRLDNVEVAGGITGP